MIQFSPEKNIKGAVSPYEQYCDGFKGSSVSGDSYITSLILSVAKTKVMFSHQGSQLIDSIIAYDKAEAETAYIGQINMSVVSSFCGPNGLIWGYDIAKALNLRVKHFLAPSFIEDDREKVPVYSAQPIEDASLSLFGSLNQRHFPFIPGAHVACAGRSFKIEGPAHIYCAIAIGIPIDRSKSAVCLMEDVGELIDIDKEALKNKILKNIAKSILLVGQQQRIVFKEIFVDIKDQKIGEKEKGCSLVAMPYFTLAKKAIIDNDTNKTIKASLSQWEEKSKKFFLNN